MSAVLGNFKNLGFELDKLFIFPRRGDFGLLNFVDQGNDSKDGYLGYDYLILCHKVADQEADGLAGVNLEGPFSKTAIAMATQAGFSSPKEFFESIGVD